MNLNFIVDLSDKKNKDITDNDIKMYVCSVSQKSLEKLAFLCINNLVKNNKMTFKEIDKILSNFFNKEIL